jgi:Na+/proline symporter
MLLILLAFALALHLVGMSDHSMMFGMCLAVIAVGSVMWLVDRVRGVRPGVAVAFARALPSPGLPTPRTGRPPPEHGTILRP